MRDKEVIDCSFLFVVFYSLGDGGCMMKCVRYIDRALRDFRLHVALVFVSLNFFYY